MSRSIALILLCFSFAGSSLAQAPSGGRMITFPTHTEALDNGLETIVISMPGSGLVSFWVIVRTGSRDEFEPGHTGFAHFFEHMMFRGTERYPADLYNEILTEIGASRNAYTTDDLTAYHVSIAAEDLALVMDLESDRFKNLAYAEDVFRTEAGAVYGEYRKNVTNPFFAIYEGIMTTAFDAHTYGHTTMGFEEDIAAMPTMYDYSLSFFSRYYRPENVILLVVGDVEAAPTMDLVREYYADWEPGYVAPQIPVEPEQTEEKHVEVSYAGRTLPMLALAYKFDAFDPNNRLRVAADLLTEMAFGSTSDLYRKLVLDEQVVEFLAADAARNRDPGLLDLYTRVKDPERVDDVLEAIDATITTFTETLVDEADLTALKSRLRYGFLMGLETPDAVAGGLARIVAITGGIEAVDALYAAYETITPEDVREAARHYLDPNRRTVGVLRAEQ
ncbi:MAG: insulinase family protein [Gammaproteobacteria bacterium]|nr:insulinase family protein [Gammaproteobacteria bacterium]MDH3507099.1 insulinase family protein [Gammaproteobacteria bacterium]